MAFSSAAGDAVPSGVPRAPQLSSDDLQDDVRSSHHGERDPLPENTLQGEGCVESVEEAGRNQHGSGENGVQESTTELSPPLRFLSLNEDAIRVRRRLLGRESLSWSVGLLRCSCCCNEAFILTMGFSGVFLILQISALW